MGGKGLSSRKDIIYLSNGEFSALTAQGMWQSETEMICWEIENAL